MKKTTIAWILGAASVAASLPFAAQAYNAQEVLNSITASGLVAPQDLEKQYGYWTAKATQQDGNRAYVLVNDADGSLLAIRKAELGSTYPGASQVAAKLQAMGYGQIKEVEFDDGFWEAKVRGANGIKQKLVLHPVSLEVLSQPGQPAPNPGAGAGSAMLSAAQIHQLLTQAGYTHIRDLELDDGIWEADAINAQGFRVELKIHPETGVVLREKLDD
ncbi:PepSY domain-containing protein [uncultured Comamonas sp.]|uniref:PepSY domain-containing protein n=1 Tax=uncultured Comamonas sp. TaxID=114710 RepID=UPI0037499D31